jgi:EpsI family protein
VASNFRFAAAAILLAAAAWFLTVQSRSEIIQPREEFGSFPHQFGPWTGKDVDVPRDILDVLGPGDFLFRNYQDVLSSDPSVNLFIAYFSSQRAGDTIHSPKNCLPGAGWIPLDSSQIEISLPNRKPFLVNRYLIGKGTQRDLVLYWYWAHNRGIASEYWAKFYLIEDSIRLHRSDGSLVRVTTELRQSESVDVAQQRLLSLLQNVVPALDVYIPE